MEEDDVEVHEKLTQEVLKHCVIAHPRDVDKKHHDEGGDRKALPTIECHVYDHVMDDEQTLIHVDIEEKRFRDALSKIATTYKGVGVKKTCQYFYMDLQYTQQDDRIENRENRAIAQVIKVTSLRSCVLEKPKLMLRVLRREKMPYSMFPSVSTLHDKRHLTSASFMAWQSGNIKVTLHFEEYDDSAGHHIRRIYFKLPVISSVDVGGVGGVGRMIAKTMLNALRHAGLEA
jgi:hypothetical protein